MSNQSEPSSFALASLHASEWERLTSGYSRLRELDEMTRYLSRAVATTARRARRRVAEATALVLAGL